MKSPLKPFRSYLKKTGQPREDWACYLFCMPPLHGFKIDSPFPSTRLSLIIHQALPQKLRGLSPWRFEVWKGNKEGVSASVFLAVSHTLPALTECRLFVFLLVCRLPLCCSSPIMYFQRTSTMAGTGRLMDKTTASGTHSNWTEGAQGRRFGRKEFEMLGQLHPVLLAGDLENHLSGLKPHVKMGITPPTTLIFLPNAFTEAHMTDRLSAHTEKSGHLPYC